MWGTEGLSSNRPRFFFFLNGPLLYRCVLRALSHDGFCRVFFFFAKVWKQKTNWPKKTGPSRNISSLAAVTTLLCYWDLEVHMGKLCSLLTAAGFPVSSLCTQLICLPPVVLYLVSVLSVFLSNSLPERSMKKTESTCLKMSNCSSENRSICCSSSAAARSSSNCEAVSIIKPSYI